MFIPILHVKILDISKRISEYSMYMYLVYEYQAQII